MKITESQQMKIQKKVDKLVQMKNDRALPMSTYEQVTLVSISQQLRKGFRLSINQASWVADLYKRQLKAGRTGLVLK